MYDHLKIRRIVVPLLEGDLLHGLHHISTVAQNRHTKHSNTGSRPFTSIMSFTATGISLLGRVSLIYAYC